MEFIGGLGIGAAVAFVIQRVAQHLLDRFATQQDRRDKELKEAYTGFLEALSRFLSNRDVKKADVDFRYWVARVRLVCSKEILEILWDLENKNRDLLRMEIDVEALVLAMRRDLKIAS